MEDLGQVTTDRRMVRMSLHEVGHVGPPFFDDFLAREAVHLVVFRALLNREEDAGGLFEID